MAAEYIPRPYAKIATEFMLRDGFPRTGLFAPPGMGKTILTYTVLAARMCAGYTDRPTLVIGPKRVARDVWPDEVNKWNHLSGFPVLPITGNEEQRLRALRRDAEVYTINYELLPWLVSRLHNKWPFDTVVADESTKLKGYRTRQGGIRAESIATMAAKSKFWINLTGTPASNGLQDLWGQTWFLDFGKRLGLTYQAFLDRWFKTDPETGVVVPLKYADKEIHEKISDICLSLDPKEWFDLREPIITEIKVKLPKAAQKLYDDMEERMFIELMEHGIDVEALNGVTALQKCMQIANGGVIAEGKYLPLHDAKFEALSDLLSEFEHTPVLVAYEFIGERERIMREFPGAVRLADKEGMATFKAGQARIGLVHGRSVAHGVDGLQNVTNVLIRMGHNWNLEDRLQLMDRIGPVRQKQAGLDRSVLVYDIVAKGTVDEDIIKRHTSKRKVQDLLLEAMHYKRKVL